MRHSIYGNVRFSISAFREYQNLGVTNGFSIALRGDWAFTFIKPPRRYSVVRPELVLLMDVADGFPGLHTSSGAPSTSKIKLLF